MIRIRCPIHVALAIVTWAMTCGSLRSQEDFPVSGGQIWKAGDFQWRVSQPLLAVSQEHLPESEHPWIAVKDPSIVRFDGKWHLFCTLRKRKTGQGRIRIGYCSFEDWPAASQATWSVLDLTLDYHGAPQIFYFQPHDKWYLVYQAADESRGLKYGPCFSTSSTIDDPTSWTKPEPLYVVPEGEKAGLDFWVICDEQHAHLLFTSLNGQMWHAQTELRDFPNRNWTKPKVVLQADIFEASHTYKLNGLDAYLTLVEAQNGKRRYFKFFAAKQLSGPWLPVAATRKRPAVSVTNVVNQNQSWATSYSHGEILRSGYDQRMQIEPESLQILFQGASDPEYQQGGYGDITWRLGLLHQVTSQQPSSR
ncbi:MAG TPA: glycoside hydrolase [Planctomycetaceae bacterium]|nr:glycoside hydrolase [Planctomycetaceae bacterium]